jgi:hypothetical protein
MTKKEKKSASESGDKEGKENSGKKIEKYDDLGKEVLLRRLKNQQRKMKKKDQIISVLEEENENLKRDIKDRDSTIADLKESVLNLELMLNKAQRAERQELEPKKKDKTLDYFIP